MVGVTYIQNIISEIKACIIKCIDKKNYNDALALISVCANILYQTNICYVDNELENYIDTISKKISILNSDTEYYRANEDYVLFYDGFGLNDRGLAQIYLKALCKIKKVVYVTYADRETLIPDIKDILVRYNCEQRYIIRKKKTLLEQINQLHDVIKEFCPAKMFFYSYPHDVVAPPIMYAYENLIMRYQINLTDHAFWLGTGCIDKCIEFRNYGAKISKEYRYIDEDKIIIIPFYPIVHKEKEFQGFPFKKSTSQKVIFSGGSLYKTISEDNKYYEMVECILKKHPDTIFWYAGFGDDTKIKKLSDKYPERVFLTAERTDLLQVLENCDMYLSTYPMCGGLMFQYAAIAGRVPVTLKSGNISDEFLINQANINVEFTDIDLLYKEVDKLLSDEGYSRNRGELMKESVISPNAFESEVKKLIFENGENSFPAEFTHIDTTVFRQWYLEGLSKLDIDAMLASKKTIKLGVVHYPLRILRGGIYQAIKKIRAKHIF